MIDPETYSVCPFALDVQPALRSERVCATCGQVHYTKVEAESCLYHYCALNIRINDARNRLLKAVQNRIIKGINP